MKVPKVSVLTIMAVVILVAADCMACRAVATRPDGLTYGLSPLLLVGLPMTNLLAIAAACWIRGRKTLGSFWPGFLMLGVVALGITIAKLDAIFDFWETTLTQAGLVAWIGQSASRELFVWVTVAPLVFLAPQVLVASVGGGLTRWLGRRKATPIDAASPRRRLTALVAMTAIVAIPGVGVEAYLVRASDRKIDRLAVNTEASVVVEQFPVIKQKVPATTPPTYVEEPVPQVALGTRVKVERDEQPSIIQYMEFDQGKTFGGDFRSVRVTLIDGPNAGTTRRLPRYSIEALR